MAAGGMSPNANEVQLCIDNILCKIRKDSRQKVQHLVSLFLKVWNSLLEIYILLWYNEQPFRTIIGAVFAVRIADYSNFSSKFVKQYSYLSEKGQLICIH